LKLVSAAVILEVIAFHDDIIIYCV